MADGPPETSARGLTQRRSLVALCGLAALLGIATLGAEFRSRALQADAAVVAVLGASSVVPSTAPPTTATPTSSTATTEPPPLPRRTAVLAFTGDTLADRGVVRQASVNASSQDGPDYDFGPMFDHVRQSLTAADLAICHLETPLSPDNRNLGGYPTFNVPHELAIGLADAGYDGCTTASNHSLDRRSEGVVATLDVLDDAGLSHSGTARNLEEYETPTIYDASGIAVASLSYSYGFNGFAEPVDTPWLVNQIDVAEITAEVQRAKSAGAEYVVVSLHWGTEYRHEPDSYQREQAERIAAIEGVDIVIGHHAHVVQPVDIIGDVPIVYGLGNFLSNQSSNCCAAGSQDGVIMQVHIQELPDAEGPGFRTWLTYVPTRVDRTDYSIVPVVDALGSDELTDAARTELERSRDRTSDALRLLSDDVGLVEVRCSTC